MARCQFADVGGGKPALAEDLDAVAFRELVLAVVAHPRPFTEARQPALQADAAAELAPRFGQGDLMAALGQRQRGFEAGRAGATTSTRSGFLARAIRSGCQSRRHSSPMVGFWVQRSGTPWMSLA